MASRSTRNNTKKNSKKTPEPEKKIKKAYTPALYKRGQVGSRAWMIDMDYIESLSEKEKVWLDRFVHEYHLASFKKEGKSLHKKSQRTEIYRNNNSSNRCMTSLQGSKTQNVNKGAAQIIDSLYNNRDLSSVKTNIEDALIDLIDLGNSLPEEAPLMDKKLSKAKCSSN